MKRSVKLSMFDMFASAVASSGDTGPMDEPSEEDAVALAVVLMKQIRCCCTTEDRK